MASEPRLKVTWGALVVIVLLAAFLWWTDTLGTGDDQAGTGGTTTAASATDSPTASPTPTSSPTPTDAPTSPTASARPTSATPSPPTSRPTSTPTSTPSPSATVDPVSGLPLVLLSDLPIEAAEVVEDIDAGGPYEFDRDGITFGNYEGILPDRERGYYREYTVPTPGLDHRGARRIVTGGDTLYWTDDHYESFSVIVR